MREESPELSNLPLFLGSYLVVDTAHIQSSSLLIQGHEIFVSGLFTLLQKVWDGEVWNLSFKSGSWNLNEAVLLCHVIAFLSFFPEYLRIVFNSNNNDNDSKS